MFYSFTFPNGQTFYIELANMSKQEIKNKLGEATGLAPASFKPTFKEDGTIIIHTDSGYDELKPTIVKGNR